MTREGLLRTAGAALVFGGVAIHVVPAAAEINDGGISLLPPAEVGLSPKMTKTLVEDISLKFAAAKDIVRHGGDAIDYLDAIRKEVKDGFGDGYFPLTQFYKKVKGLKDITRDSVNALDRRGAFNVINTEMSVIQKGVENGKDMTVRAEKLDDLITSRLDKGYDEPELKKREILENMQYFGQQSAANGVIELYRFAKDAARFKDDIRPYLQLIDKKIGDANGFDNPRLKEKGITAATLDDLHLLAGRNLVQTNIKRAVELAKAGKDNLKELSLVAAGIALTKGFAEAEIDPKLWREIGGWPLDKNGTPVEKPAPLEWPVKFQPAGKPTAVLLQVLSI